MGISELLQNTELGLADKLIAIRTYLDKNEDFQLSSAGQERFLKQAYNTSQYANSISEDVNALIDKINKIRNKRNASDYSQSGFRAKIEKILDKYYSTIFRISFNFSSLKSLII